MTVSAPTGMTQIAAGLYASSPQALAFEPSVGIRAFLLQRPGGNVLIYETGELDGDREQMEHLGGVSRQYLNHWHEAMFGAGWAAEAFGAPLFVHEDDAAEVRARGGHVRGTFDRRHHFEDDIEAIPMPGHTPGATAYLWDSGERRALFTGDSLYLKDGELVAAVLDSSDRRSYIESLETLRELDFDLFVPWAASAAGPPALELAPGEGGERIDTVLARLRTGGRH